MDLRRIDRIPHIMPFAISDKSDQALRLPKFLTDEFHNIDVPHLIVSADIIDLSDASLVYDKVNSLAVIFDIQPVADVFPFAVDRQGLSLEGVGDHQRNQLFGEVVGPVVVRAAADRHGAAVGAVVRHDQQIRGGLAGRIGRRRVDRRLFGEEQVGTVQRQIAVDLVRRHLMEPDVAVGATAVEQDLRAENVRLEKDLRRVDRTVDVRFRGEVDDGVDRRFVKQRKDRVAVGDVRSDKAEAVVFQRGRQRFKIARVGQRVQPDHAQLGVPVEHIIDKVGTDKAGSAGDKQRIHSKPSRSFLEFRTAVRTGDFDLAAVLRDAQRLFAGRAGIVAVFGVLRVLRLDAEPAFNWVPDAQEALVFALPFRDVL